MEALCFFPDGTGTPKSIDVSINHIDNLHSKNQMSDTFNHICDLCLIPILLFLDAK